jgi:hypothetical protein
MLRELRPYRRRLTILVVLAALAGVAFGELVPAHRAAPPVRTTHQR